MDTHRVQLGRHGPQFTFAWHQGRACLLDHDKGRSVTNSADRVCEFLQAQLPMMPADHDIIYLATDGLWCVLRQRDGRFEGVGRGYRVATDDEAALGQQALGDLVPCQGAA